MATSSVMIDTYIHITNHSCHAYNEFLPRYWLRCTCPSVSFQLHASHRFYCLTVSVHPLHLASPGHPLSTGTSLERYCSSPSGNGNLSGCILLFQEVTRVNPSSTTSLGFWFSDDSPNPTHAALGPYTSATRVLKCGWKPARSWIELTDARCKIRNLTQLSWDKMPWFEGERHFVGGSFSTGEWEENATYLGV